MSRSSVWSWDDVQPDEPRAPMKIRMGESAMVQPAAHASPFKIPKPAPGVLPSGGMAMDDAFSPAFAYGNEAICHEGLSFLGYPYLAELSQRPEYRHITETIAKEMTRKWVTLHAPGEDDKSEKLAQLDEAMKRYRVRDIFRRAAEVDGFFGRAHIYLDFGNADPAELKLPLLMKSAKIGKKSLKRLKVIEPLWTYPAGYNATNPLAEGFYDPKSWYVMGTEIDRSRLLTIVGREVPDLLKPAYMFGGLSISQMVKTYVDHWLSMRDSTAAIAKAFSVMVLSTDLTDALAGGSWEAVTQRVAFFNQYRDNRGTFVVNKDTETFQNVSAPLGGLHELLAQAQEQMGSAAAIPLVKFLGIQPAGLNASSAGELEAWNDTIAAMQQHLFAPNIKRVLDVIQLSEFGEIDPDIDFRFEPLKQMTESEQAAIRKTNADTAAVYMLNGTVGADEERARLANEEGGLYSDLDLDVVPDREGKAGDAATATIAAYEAQLIDRPQALKGLAASGMFPQIDDAAIIEAENEPPPVPVETDPPAVPPASTEPAVPAPPGNKDLNDE
jgi:phage-related protein (TIGR01555 family)